MWYSVCWLILNLIIPIIMIVCGEIFIKGLPKEINHIFGYRTAMSMKNKETWEFAHKYCGRLWIKIGTIVGIFSVCINLFIIMFDTQVKSMVGISINILQTIIIVATIHPVERELKRNFDKNGSKIKK